MYPSSTPITSTSMTYQGQGRIYEPFRSVGGVDSGFSQYGSVTSVGSVYQPHMSPGTSSSLYPQSSIPSYQQSSQEHYRPQLGQQSTHLPYMPKSMPSTVFGFHQKSQPTFRQGNISARNSQQYFQQGSQTALPSAYFPREPTTAVPGNSHHTAAMHHQQAPGMMTNQHSVGPSTLPQPHPAFRTSYKAPGFRAANAASTVPPSYEHTIHTVTNACNQNQNNVDVMKNKFSALQQSLHPSPTLTGQQNSWTLNKDVLHGQHSLQAAATALSSRDSQSTNRMDPATSSYNVSLPTEAQTTSHSATTGHSTVNLNCPRLCHITKESETQPYGFNFATQRDGEYVLRVDKGSAAESAGLKAEDRIIEVNGFNVEEETHEQILQRMTGLPTEMKLLVVDRPTDMYFKRRQIKVSSSMPEVRHLATSLRTTVAPDSYKRREQLANLQPTYENVSPTLSPQSSRPPSRPYVPHTAFKPETFPTVTVQRPFIYDGNKQVSQSCETEISLDMPSLQPEISEPDDKKLLGQWYAQPESPKPSKLSSSATAQTAPVNVTVPTTESDVRRTLSLSSENAPSEGMRTSPALTSLVQPPPDVIPGLLRPDSPTALVQNKIFEMVKQGKPFSVFNNVSQAESEAAVTDSNTPLGLTYVGSYRVAGKTKQVDGHEQSNTVPVSEQSTVSRENVTDYLSSASLANQLDIDKTIAMQNLQMGTGSMDDNIYRENDDALDLSNAAPSSINAYIPSTSEIAKYIEDSSSPPQLAPVVPLRATTPDIQSANISNISEITKDIERSKSPPGLAPVVPESTSVPSTEITDISDIVKDIEKSKSPPRLAPIIPERATIPSIDSTNIPNISNTCIAKDKSRSNSPPGLAIAVPKNAKTSPKLKVASGSKKTEGKSNSQKTSSDHSKKSKLKVKISAPVRKVSGSESPSKKVTLTWKKKMAMKAISDQKATDLENFVQESAAVEPQAGQSESETQQSPTKKKKRKSTEAELNDTSQPAKRQHGRGRGRNRGRGSAIRATTETASRARGRGGRVAHAGKTRVRGRGKGRGARIIAPAHYLSLGSLRDYVSQNNASLQANAGILEPAVVLDVDEVLPSTSSSSPHNVSPSVASTENSPSKDSNSRLKETLIKKIGQMTEEDIRNAVTEKGVILSLQQSTNDSEESAKNHTETTEKDTEQESIDGNPVEGEAVVDETPMGPKELYKSDTHELSWICFHGHQIVLITSAEGKFIIMKELVKDVFGPRKPDKTQSHQTAYRALSMNLKIQHIYKTKEKRLRILYKDVDKEVFDVVCAILQEKKVLHKMPQRLGVLSLENALKLYHFITRVGTSQCIDAGEMCVKSYDRNSCKRRGEMELNYPLNFDETDNSMTVRSPKTSKLSNTTHTRALKNGPQKTVTISKPDEVIDLVSSDEESDLSDATLPYVDGQPIVNAEETAKSSISEPVIKEANIPNVVPDSLQVAPQCLNTIFYMDTMTINSDNITPEDDKQENLESQTAEINTAPTPLLTSSDSSIPDIKLKHEQKLDPQKSEEISDNVAVPNSEIPTSAIKFKQEFQQSTQKTEGSSGSAASLLSGCEIIDSATKFKQEDQMNIQNSKDNLDAVLSTETPASVTVKQEYLTSLEPSDKIPEIVVTPLVLNTGIAEPTKECEQDQSSAQRSEAKILDTAETFSGLTTEIPNSANASHKESESYPQNSKDESDSIAVPSDPDNETAILSHKSTDVNMAGKTTEEISNATASPSVANREMSASAKKFTGIKSFFDCMYDDNTDYYDEDDDDLTLIDLEGNEEKLIEEGERRVDELLEKRIRATTDEEIDRVWSEALRFQRPLLQLKKAILDGYEKQLIMTEKDEELQKELAKLRQENEELRKFVEEHKDLLDEMPECDREENTINCDD